jgi:ribosomal protein L40E
VNVTLYLVIMVGIIALVTAVSVPSLFLKKCPHCGKRNGLEARICRACGADLPEETA